VTDFLIVDNARYEVQWHCQGKDDPYGTTAQLAAIKTGVRNCKITPISNCCHAPHLEQPDVVLAHMAAFIRNIPE
jgi:pimeloyl-ACP methyl ester carboxylesterase